MYFREMVSQCRGNSFLSVKFAAIQGLLHTSVCLQCLFSLYNKALKNSFSFVLVS